jgi:hypothetical protein
MLPCQPALDAKPSLTQQTPPNGTLLEEATYSKTDIVNNGSACVMQVTVQTSQH